MRPAVARELSDHKRRLLERYQRGNVEHARKERHRIAARPPGATVPLSTEQELIWIHSQLAPELPLYNEILTVRRTGALDVSVLERSLEELLCRHEAWRSTFEVVDGVPAQIVHPPPRVSLPVVDLSALPDSEREAEAVRLATENVRRPIDLKLGPIVRATLVRMGEREHRLYIILHQIIHDGVSVYTVLLPELIALYEAFAAGKPSPLTPPEVQYGDFAYWQRHLQNEGGSSASLEYWREQLGSIPTTLDLPADHARPKVQSFRGRQQTFTLSRTLTESLKRLSQREESTLYATLLTAFKVLLYRYSGQEDLCIGTAISTRKRPELENLLGVFLNTVVVRTRVAESASFRELLRGVREVAVEALSHGDVPFHALVKALQPRRDPGQNPLFQVSFVLEPPMPPPVVGWELTQMDVDTGVARVDLYLQMDDRPEGLVGHIRYNAELWEDETISRLVEHFNVLLEGIVDGPEVAISALPLLTAGERLGGAAARNHGEPRPANAFTVFESSEVDQSIPQRFARMVERHGSRPAVNDGKNEWTYTELDRAANRVASALVAETSPGNMAALLLGHDAPMVAAILGSLKAGFTYVPLDPANPSERLRQIIADAGADVIVASRDNLALARELATGSVSVLDLEQVLRAPAPARDFGRDVLPDQTAYILYTSGSTGKPKGVTQNHRNVLHFIAAYTNNLHIRPDDRLSLLASYGVDAAAMDIFGALMTGATLFPIDVKGAGLRGTAERLLDRGITIYHSTPTLFRQVVRELSGRARPSAVRLVVLGGEEVRHEDFDAYRGCFGPHCLLVNGFGPTESTVSLQYFANHHTKLARRSVPVGRPVERTAVALLSRLGRPGQVYGEIALQSPHVALGYWKKPEVTSAAFLPDPGGGKARVYKTGDMGRLLPDGNIEFCGRRDLQTKIQGFRVELGEIEAALMQHPRVKDAAATVHESEGGEKRLIAYFTTHSGPAPEGTAIRRFLRDHLPGHMIPSSFVPLDVMPLTRSGKLDRRALPPVTEAPRAEQAREEPRDARERQLADIWKAVLGVRDVGIRDDFFELGGHSLSALRMMAEIERQLGVSLPLGVLFESPTIERLAEALRPSKPAGTGRAIVAHQTTGCFPPLFCVHGHVDEVLFYRALSRRLGPEQPLYGLQAPDLAHTSARHDIRAMAAENVDKIRAIHPKGPYFLGGYCGGGAVAFEMAHQLRSQGAEVALLAIFWGAPPRATLSGRVRSHLQMLQQLGAAETLTHLFQRVLPGADRGNRIGTLGDYEPRPYTGRMTVLHSGEPPPRGTVDVVDLGGMAASELELIPVPGDRDTMLREPFVHELARRLEAVLGRFRE